MPEVEIDVSLISSFSKKLKDPKADIAVKKLGEEWGKIVKGYIVNASNSKHYVLVEDVDKFNALVEKIKNIVK